MQRTMFILGRRGIIRMAVFKSANSSALYTSRYLSRLNCNKFEMPKTFPMNNYMINNTRN